MIIGILQPLSNAHPGIAKDFIDAFNASLLHNKIAENITIKKENVGFGGMEKDVYAKAEKLLISDDVDILIAYVDEKVTSLLYPLIQSTGKFVLIVNPGANHPLNWIGQPTVMHLNLQHAFLCWLTGKVAAGSGSGSAAYASSFYDCGYLLSADMVKNFVASGGDILHNYINNQAYDDKFEINQLSDFLTFSPDCENLLCVYDEKPASLFYNRLNKHKTDKPLQLYVSPMMLTENALTEQEGGYNFSIKGYIPWQPALNTEGNRVFTNACTRQASVFSLLGWEAGLVIAEIMQACKADLQDGEAIAGHLKQTTLNGPRGQMIPDAETGHYLMPVGTFTLSAGSANAIVEWKTDFGNEWKAFTSLQTTGAVTGWTNTYLCY